MRYSLLYNFAWSEVFDWFIELSKALTDGPEADEVKATLGVVLRDIIKLFHPVIPFLTEELWSELVGEGFVAASSWPTIPAVDSSRSMGAFQEVVSGIRQFRSTHQLSPKAPLAAVINDPESVAEPWWDRQLASLANATATFIG